MSFWDGHDDLVVIGRRSQPFAQRAEHTAANDAAFDVIGSRRDEPVERRPGAQWIACIEPKAPQVELQVGIVGREPESLVKIGRALGGTEAEPVWVACWR